MALRTIHLLVFAFEREMCLSVVVLFQGAQGCEGLLRVAFLAVGSQVRLVGILVATVAIAERHIGKPLEFLASAGFLFVTFGTGHRFVCAYKGVIRFVVVKFCGRRKLFGGVAFRAIGCQGILVHIGVAGLAVPTQTQIRRGLFFQGRILDELRFVAFATVGGFVCAIQLVPRQVVVEFIFVETYEVEIPSVVVVVAGGAFLAFDFAGGVVTGALVQLAFDFFVAAQAFVVRNLIAQHVAFGAVGYPLQLGMWLRQVAGRQLGLHLKKETGENQGTKEDFKFHRKRYLNCGD